MPIVRIGQAYNTGGSHRLQIDAGKDGSIVVLSNEASSFLSRLEEDGSETVLNQSPTVGNFSSGFVETLSDGRYVLYTTANFGQNSGTLVQIVNRDGSLATGIVNPMFEGMDRYGSGYTLTPTNNGGFGFVWNDLSRGSDSFQLTYPQDPNNGSTSATTFAGYDVRVRYFDEAAAPTSSSVVADEDIESVKGATVNRRAQDQYINDSETLAGGQTAFVYVDSRWVANAGGGAHTEFQLSLQISTPSDGGEPVKIDLGPFGNTSADGNYPDSLFPEASANIVPLPDGSFAVIWSERTYVPAAVFGGYSYTGTQTVIRYFNAAGEALSDQTTLVTRGTDYGNNNLFVWAEALPDGRIAIAYNTGVDGVNGNGRLDAFVGIVGPLGSSLEVSRVNAEPAANTQFYTVQDLAVRTDGTIELAYNQVVVDPDNRQRNETVIQRFGTAEPGEVVVNGTADGESLQGGSSDDILFGLGGDDNLSGLGGADLLQGGDGNDTLDGGAGADRMVGGAGSDLYVVDDMGDVVSEGANQGTDEVRTTLASYTLPANVERIVYTGSGSFRGTGGAANDQIVGGAGVDLLDFSAGGDDRGEGGGGNDGFFFGAALTAADSVDGGEGVLDQVGLQGNYAGLVLGANNLTGIEQLVLLSGADTRFGAPGTASHSYDLTTVDGNVASGQSLVITFNTLRAGENVTFNGAAETDGSFITYAGLGTDNLTGGQQSDGFFFGADGRFGPGDKVDGQGGTLDQFALKGDYSGANALALASDAITNIEMIVLLSAGDDRFGAGSADGFSYDLTLSDGNAAAGSILYVSANQLAVDGTLNETLRLDGSAETDARLIAYGGGGGDTLIGGAGADELFGRGGNDMLTGGGGADLLHGGEGADRFIYTAAAQSAAGARDTILDFAAGDLIDLTAIDAVAGGSDDAFTVIAEDAAFTSPGQLRITQSSGGWLVEAELDGDGIADFVIAVTTADPGYQFGSGDLLL
jgi:Ca2+-binding RTX toxin-like protein